MSSSGMGCSAGVRVLVAYSVALYVGLRVGIYLWDLAPGAEYVALVTCLLIAWDYHCLVDGRLTVWRRMRTSTGLAAAWIAAVALSLLLGGLYALAPMPDSVIGALGTGTAVVLMGSVALRSRRAPQPVGHK